MGNSDSEYKRALFDKINMEMSNIKDNRGPSTVTSKLNKNFHFEFVPQKDEEIRINSIFS